jgi:hypothetical protein
VGGAVYIYSDRNSTLKNTVIELARVRDEQKMRTGLFSALDERIVGLKLALKDKPSFEQCATCRRECRVELRRDIQHEIDMKWDELKRCIHSLGQQFDRFDKKLDRIMEQRNEQGS